MVIRAVFLVFLLSSGCASVLTGRVVNAGDAEPVPGATVLVEPVSHLPTPGRRSVETTPPPAVGAEFTCDIDGRFELRHLRDEAGNSAALQSGWSYEVRAEALGYYATVERVDVTGRNAEVELRVYAIEEVTMDGDIIEGEAEGRHDGLNGGLINEVLRRSGRLPGGG